MRTVHFGLLVGISCLVSCTTSHTVRRLTKDEPLCKSTGGVVYSLPRTAIQASLKLRRVDKSPGPLVRFVDLYRADLGFPAATAVVISPSTTFSVVEVSLSSRGVPDPSQLFVAEFDDGIFRDAELQAALTGAGVLTELSSSSSDHTAAFVIQTVVTAAQIAAAAAPLAAGLKVDDKTITISHKVDPKSDASAVAKALMQDPDGFANLREDWVQVYRSVPPELVPKKITKGLLVEARILADFAKRKTISSVGSHPEVDYKLWKTVTLKAAKKASAAYETLRLAYAAKSTIKALRGLRTKMDSAYLPSPGMAETNESIDRRLKALNDRADEYRAAFLGSSRTSDFQVEVEFVPDSYSAAAPNREATIGKLNSVAGFIRGKLTRNTALGSRLLGSATHGSELLIRLEVDSDQAKLFKQLDETIPELKADDARGFFYRVPLPGGVTVVLRDSLLEKDVTLVGDQKTTAEAVLKRGSVLAVGSVLIEGGKQKPVNTERKLLVDTYVSAGSSIKSGSLFKKGSLIAPADLPAGAQLKQTERIVASRTLPIGQDGRIAWLPRRLWGTESSYSLTVHPETGGLRSAHLTSKGVSEDLLVPLGDAAERAAGAIQAYRDARDAREARRAERRDPLNQTTRDADLLEQQLRLRNLQRDLDGQ